MGKARRRRQARAGGAGTVDISKYLGDNQIDLVALAKKKRKRELAEAEDKEEEEYTAPTRKPSKRARKNITRRQNKQMKEMAKERKEQEEAFQNETITVGDLMETDKRKKNKAHQAFNFSRLSQNYVPPTSLSELQKAKAQLAKIKKAKFRNKQAQSLFTVDNQGMDLST